MESDNRSVFERLDSQDQKLDSIINILSKQQSQINKQNIVVQQPNNDEEALATFIKKSKKEYLWFGPSSEFIKSKNLMIILSMIFLLVSLISTILTSIAFKTYSIFTLFENIWTIMSCFILGYSIHSKKRMTDIDLMKHSVYKYIQDADGIWRCTNKEKKKYKIFRIISYICVVPNIILIWTSSSGELAVFATLFEIAFAGLSIGLFFAEVNLSRMYGNIILFTGKGAEDKLVTIVFDAISRKLVTYEEFEAKFKQILI